MRSTEGSVRTTAVSALVAAEVISVLGTRMTYLALPWFVLVTTGSPGKMTLVLAAEIAPMVVLGIPSGMLVRRLGSRNTMLIADFARAPILASIPILHSQGALTFPLLLAIVALLGCFMPPYFASQRTILPELVGEDERRMSQANSLVEGGAAFSALLGPAIAGLLIPFIGASNVLYVDAATYLVAFLLVLTLVPARKAAAAAGAAGQKVLDGVRFLLRDPLLGPLAAIVVVTGFLSAGLSAGLPFYAYEEFEGSSRIAGVFYASLGAGALVGSIVAVGAVRKVAPLRLSGLAMLAFAATLWALPFLPPWPVVVVALFVATFFTPLINGPLIAVLTSRTPEELRALVITAVISINTFAAPLGFLVAGQVLERWGLVPLFTATVAGVSLVAVSYAALVLRHGDEDAAVPPEPVAVEPVAAEPVAP